MEGRGNKRGEGMRERRRLKGMGRRPETKGMGREGEGDGRIEGGGRGVETEGPFPCLRPVGAVARPGSAQTGQGRRRIVVSSAHTRAYGHEHTHSSCLFVYLFIFLLKRNGNHDEPVWVIVFVMYFVKDAS